MCSTLYAVLSIYSHARWELPRWLRSWLLCLHGVFQALIEPLACWFCTGALGPILFQNIFKINGIKKILHTFHQMARHMNVLNHTHSAAGHLHHYIKLKSVYQPQPLHVRTSEATPRRPSPQQQQSLRSYTSLQFTTWFYLFLGFINNS